MIEMGVMLAATGGATLLICVSVAAVMCAIRQRPPTPGAPPLTSSATPLIRPLRTAAVGDAPSSPPLPSPVAARRASVSRAQIGAASAESRRAAASALAKFAEEGNWALLDSVCDAAAPSEADSLAISLIYVLGPATARTAVAHSIAREVTSSRNRLELLRGNNCAVRSFAFLARFRGQRYLASALASVVGDPEGVRDVVTGTSAVLRGMSESARMLDRGIAEAITSARAAAEAKFGAEGATQAASTLFFLRFVCPAVVAPHLYGVCAYAPDEEHTEGLIQIARVLQCIANGTSLPETQRGTSGTDPVVLNEYIRNSHAAAMRAMDEALTTASGDDTALQLSPQLADEAAATLAAFMEEKLPRATVAMKRMEV